VDYNFKEIAEKIHELEIKHGNIISILVSQKTLTYMRTIVDCAGNYLYCHNKSVPCIMGYSVEIDDEMSNTGIGCTYKEFDRS